MVHFTDRVTGATVYINPEYVMSIRPDPAGLRNATLGRIARGGTPPRRRCHRLDPRTARRSHDSEERQRRNAYEKIVGRSTCN
jgi:hypothetical protein